MSVAGTDPGALGAWLLAGALLVLGVFARGREVAAAVVDFVTFAERLLQYELDLGQRAFALVAFDKTPPPKLGRKYRRAALKMFGGVKSIPPLAHTIVVLVGGRGGGKSQLGVVRLLHRALSMPLPNVVEPVVFVIVAPNFRQSRRDLQLLTGLVQRDPTLLAMVVNSTADELVMRLASGHLIRFAAFPAGRAGGAIRGETIGGALVDECAQFRAEGADVSDVEVLNAITPRLLPGGEIIIVSTPLGETGLLYELHRDNFGKPATALVAHAGTLDLRSDPATAAMVERERKRDPRNAEREFGAQFAASSTALLPVDQRRRLFDRGVRERPYDPQCEYGVIVDWARKRDALVVLVFHLVARFEGDSGVPILERVVDAVVRLHPKLLRRTVRLEEGAEALRTAVQRYRVRHVWCDQHEAGYIQSLGDAGNFRVTVMSSAPRAQHERANAFIGAAGAELVRLVDDRATERELIDAQMTLRPSGLVVVEARQGATDDIVDCILGMFDPDVPAKLRASGDLVRVVPTSCYFDQTTGTLHGAEPTWHRRLPSGKLVPAEPPVFSGEFQLHAERLLARRETTPNVEKWLRAQAEARGVDPSEFIHAAVNSGGLNLKVIN